MHEGASVEELIKSSDEFLRAAFEEFERGLKEGSTLRLRDAAEKAWNAVVQAVNALVLKHEGYVPRTHYERRSALKELERKNPRFRELGFYDRYAARSRLLHGEVFYEGVLDPELLRHEPEKAKEYVELIIKEGLKASNCLLSQQLYGIY